MQYLVLVLVLEYSFEVLVLLVLVPEHAVLVAMWTSHFCKFVLFD